MFKAPEIKEFLLFRNGTPPDCQPIFLDAKEWQMVSRKEIFDGKTGPFPALI
jgi:hypothetical protein